MRPKSKYYDLMFQTRNGGEKIYATKEYSTYMGMLSRVKSKEKYALLGVSNEFLGPEGFKRFYDEVGPAPSPRHTLDRIDNTRGYLLGNIRWATYTEQLRNTSKTFMVSMSDGSKLSMRDFCEMHNLNPQVLRQYYEYHKIRDLDEKILRLRYIKGEGL